MSLPSPRCLRISFTPRLAFSSTSSPHMLIGRRFLLQPRRFHQAPISSERKGWRLFSSPKQEKKDPIQSSSRKSWRQLYREAVAKNKRTPPVSAIQASQAAAAKQHQAGKPRQTSKMDKALLLLLMFLGVIAAIIASLFLMIPAMIRATFMLFLAILGGLV